MRLIYIRDWKMEKYMFSLKRQESSEKMSRPRIRLPRACTIFPNWKLLLAVIMTPSSVIRFHIFISSGIL